MERKITILALMLSFWTDVLGPHHDLVGHVQMGGVAPEDKRFVPMSQRIKVRAGDLDL
jgi:hypothetical protein